MADEHDKWLDRDAAERLLRGEPLEAVDADTQGRAKQLADALGALAPEPGSGSTELPGEAAALAAFRTVRAGKDGESAHPGRRGRTHAATHSADTGLVRLGRPAPGGRSGRLGRPVRFGLAAALAAGMIGGVAVAAGTGVLPTPFRDDSPNPTATVSAARTPQRAQVSPSPGASEADGSESPLPDAGTSGPAGTGSGNAEARGSGAASGQPGSSGTGQSGRSREWWSDTRANCREVLDGKSLEVGRRRALEDAAGGGRRVQTYCKGILGQSGGATGEDQNTQNNQGSQGGQDNHESGKGSGTGSDQGSGDGSGNGSGGGDNGGDGEGHIRPGGNGRPGRGGILAPVQPSALTSLVSRKPTSPSPTTPAPAPRPTYSVLPLPSALGR
ncbi:hypothetical protein OG747_16850 [Streptomyces sp. NBC_01384]|uniref:hypothetical protein n=1 Tax=Streptomyces sp. NBC_01384 TaxID=2903847 RepID=UPI0032437C62